MRPLYAYFAGEEEYPDLDIQGAVDRLSRAIQCPTVNHADHSLTDFAPFGALHALIRGAYPHVMAAGQYEEIGHAVLITIPGCDESLLPCLYMSHQDVVPVLPGTEEDWTYGPFSGAVAEGYVWGRGTLDIKEQVFGVLEAAEYLLSHGRQFRRTAYLAFGDDEETLNLGAQAIAETLEERGVRLAFVLDEGGCRLTSGADFGAPGQAVYSIDLMEKGYADLELTAES
ncbi:MAG: M20/M25/M40 family metallo-hydrolase, partial [Oscillospiraceae bacterium]|nr:M20/M25/M40 family metallo-hydrolase [Oscillospiraceae bacterium]